MGAQRVDHAGMPDHVGISMGQPFPNFSANSTSGKFNYHRSAFGRWSILLANPRQLCPVFITEIGMLSSMRQSFTERGFAIAAIARATVQEQLAWQHHIVDHFEGQVKIDFPMVEDISGDILVQLGVLDGNPKADRIASLTRTIFVVDPSRKLRTTLSYPAHVGYCMHELLRVCDALLLTSRLPVCTPASWPDNHANLVVNGKSMEGSVFVRPDVLPEKAARVFPEHTELKVPSGKDYMRLTHLPPYSAPKLAVPCCSGILSCLPMDLFPGRQPRTPLPQLPQYTSLQLSTWGRRRSGGTTSVPDNSPSKSLDDSPIVPTTGYQKLMAAQVPSTDGVLRLGDKVPNFMADSTKGSINFHKYIEGKWMVLCHHPQAFTPVCATEVGALAILSIRLEVRGARVASLATGTLDDQQRWAADIVAHFQKQVRISFPMMADPRQVVASKLGLVDPRSKKEPIPARTILIIGPDKRLFCQMRYCDHVGFNVHEVLRVCDALMASSQESVATPACWPHNHSHLVNDKGASMEGAVLLLPTVSDEDADAFFPERMDLDMPGQRRGMRLSKLESGGRVPLCSSCISSCSRA